MSWHSSPPTTSPSISRRCDGERPTRSSARPGPGTRQSSRSTRAISFRDHTPSFMPQEALKHCDAVVIGEVELVIDRLLDDLEQGSMRGTYRADKLHPMAGMPMPRYDLLEAPLREPHVRPDLARLPPWLHVLRRAADERT